MDQYPRWKYAADGRSLVVDDADAEEALGEGWYDSPADIPDPDAEPEADDIDALRAQAEELGVKVDKRWKAERLAEEIAKAKAGE
jgi:hypothetical protein